MSHHRSALFHPEAQYQTLSQGQQIGGQLRKSMHMMNSCHDELAWRHDWTKKVGHALAKSTEMGLRDRTRSRLIQTVSSKSCIPAITV